MSAQTYPDAQKQADASFVRGRKERKTKSRADGEGFVSSRKLEEIEGKLGGVEMLTEALGIVEACGVKEGGQKVLDALGYVSVWEGMEMDKVKISKRATTKSERAI